MRLDWKFCVWLLALAAGCRTPQPNLKPPPSPDVLSMPPSEKRYDTAMMPKEAFEKDSPLKRGGFDSSSIVPTRASTVGSMGPGSAAMRGY